MKLVQKVGMRCEGCRKRKGQDTPCGETDFTASQPFTKHGIVNPTQLTSHRAKSSIQTSDACLTLRHSIPITKADLTPTNPTHCLRLPEWLFLHNLATHFSRHQLIHRVFTTYCRLMMGEPASRG
jgi:hypothetical protein